MGTYWWERTGSRAGELHAVVVSLDGALIDARQCDALADLVWDLHCAGIRVAAVTSATGPGVHRAVRDLLGDGAVELVLTGDDVSCPRPDPEVYHYALWELGVRAENALAVEDSTSGLQAAADAGLPAVLTEEPLSVWRCRRAVRYAASPAGIPEKASLSSVHRLPIRVR